MAGCVAWKQVASRVLKDGGGGEGAQPIVVVGSDTIVDVRHVGVSTVKYDKSSYLRWCVGDIDVYAHSGVTQELWGLF